MSGEPPLATPASGEHALATPASGEGPPATERALITGATGFIGGHVARRLRAEGYAVRCLVRATSDTSRLAGLGVELARGDLTDGRSVEAALAGCSHVVHCGALVSDWATVPEIRRVNVAGTRAVVAAAAAAGVRRLVHVSTTDVYGHPGGRGVEETYVPGRFANWYAETKREAERQVAGVPSVMLRPATVYGPGSREVVGEIARALRGGHMLLVDHGRAVAGLVYVENFVDAVVLALRAPAGQVDGEAFNVSDELDGVTWRRFVDDLADGLGYRRARWSLPYGVAHGVGRGLETGYRALRRATGLTVPPLLSRQAVQVLGVDQSFSAAKARARLGWAPRVGYAEGLAATVDWLRGSVV